MKTHACPRCSRDLKASGEIACPDAAPLDVFQCDSCKSEWMGVEIAFTFAVTWDGRILNPETMEEIHLRN